MLAGIGASTAEPPAGRRYYERLTAPTFTINSLTCEDAGEHRTVIPSVAIARCDVRLVGGQRVPDVIEALRRHVAEYAPDVEFRPGASMSPSRTLPESPYTDAVVAGAAAGLGEQPLIVPALGGSLPIAAFTDELARPCYGVPFANVDEANHAPNENLDLAWFRRGSSARPRSSWRWCGHDRGTVRRRAQPRWRLADLHHRRERPAAALDPAARRHR